MKDKKLTATSLRILLIILLVVIVAITSVIFYLATTRLSETATAVSHKVADAEASRNNLENLQKIEKFLEQQSASIDRVNSIVADSQSYQYQNQIILDLKQYASQAGVAITNLNFSTPASGTPPPAGAPTTGVAPVAPSISPGVKSTSVSVTLANPVAYTNLLKFVKSIEQNLTKMQISKVNLSKSPDANGITTDSLMIEVYVK